MDQKTIHKLLDNIAERNMPASVDILPGLQSQLDKPIRASASPLRYPSNAAAILVACLLFVATTVYAIVQLQIQDPALDESMVTQINLSQTIDDIAVTVDWAYADANRIVIAYSMSDEDNPLDAAIPTNQLWDSEGHRFLSVPVGYHLDQPLPEMLRGNLHYDASIVKGEPESLDLRLRLRGDFSFEFSVPFIPGVRIVRQPVIENAGLGVNLEWAIITPSMTRVFICYDTPNDDTWVPSLRVEFDGHPIGLEPGAHILGMKTNNEDANGRPCREHFFLDTYDELPNQVTFLVRHLQTATYYSEESMQRAAEVLAGHGIESEVVRNGHLPPVSYILSFTLPPTIDYVEFDRIWDEALLAAGEPLSGESIEGPWEITVDLP
ncbi:MAG: DUF4179 domain-containing protein [Anaerolineae bacterium]|nr:DUF4179 domain-containing protein [Anaerolineae bacterium]